MSASVDLLPGMRQAIRTTSFHRSASSISLTATRFRSSSPPPLIPPTTPQPLLPATLLPELRRLYEQVHMQPDLGLYIANLFAAARHHPELDGTLLTARARKDVDGLVKAGRVVGGDLTGVEIVKALAEIRAEEEETESGEPVDEPTGDESTNMKREPSVVSSARHEEVLDVSEADIGRIVPRVISHRLRVRDGPEDEILASVVYSAVKFPQGGETNGDEGERRGWERSTVKDIMVRILSEV
jgi:hypothetical protein